MPAKAGIQDFKLLNKIKNWIPACAGMTSLLAHSDTPSEGVGKRLRVKGLTGTARKLRKHSTDTEQHLWGHLRDRQIEGFKFRRQHAIGKYVVDYVNLERKVVLELDGGQHAFNPGDKMRGMAQG